MDFLVLINHLLGFVLTLYSSLDISRKTVQDIIIYIQNFSRTMYLPSIQQDILTILREEKVKDYTLTRIEECFQDHAKIFDAINSEAKRFNILRDRGFVDPEPFFVGSHFQRVHTPEDGDILVPGEMFGYKIPL